MGAQPSICQTNQLQMTKQVAVQGPGMFNEEPSLTRYGQRPAATYHDELFPTRITDNVWRCVAILKGCCEPRYIPTPKGIPLSPASTNRSTSQAGVSLSPSLPRTHVSPIGFACK